MNNSTASSTAEDDEEFLARAALALAPLGLVPSSAVNQDNKDFELR